MELNVSDIFMPRLAFKRFAFPCHCEVFFGDPTMLKRTKHILDFLACRSVLFTREHALPSALDSTMLLVSTFEWSTISL